MRIRFDDPRIDKRTGSASVDYYDDFTNTYIGRVYKACCGPWWLPSEDTVTIFPILEDAPSMSLKQMKQELEKMCKRLTVEDISMLLKEAGITDHPAHNRKTWLL